MQKKPQGIFQTPYLATTFCIALAMSVVAFESLAVSTIAPSIVREIGGKELYGWIFSSSLLLSLPGIVLAGQYIDKLGSWRVLTTALIIFSIGLLICGIAPSIDILILGRVVQGLGGGAITTSLYAGVNLGYPDALRPKVMALLSTAWIVPTLAGPALAGGVASSLSWRMVFLGTVPVTAALIFVFRTFRHVAHDVRREPPGLGATLRDAFQTTAAAALFLLGLSLDIGAGSLIPTIGGAILGVPALRRLLPAGTLSARKGLGALIATRCLFGAAFASIQIFLSVLVLEVQGQSTVMAGVVFAAGSLSWTLGSVIQAHLDTKYHGADRGIRVLVGTLILTGGVAVLLVGVMVPELPLTVTILGLAIAGLGIGVAHATVSVLAFAQAGKGREGTVASALQLADQFAPALSTGAAGALFAYALRSSFGEAGGIAMAFSLGLLLALFSVVVALRLRG